MPAPHLDRIREQFTRQADAYSRMRQIADERGLAALVALVDTKPEDRALDVACGPGFLTLAFAARCAEAVGFDATPAFVERAAAEAARRGAANARFESGEAERLPFADASFGVVACRAAFHHFPRPARVLAQMKRVTRPGGRLLVADMVSDEDPAKRAYQDRIERLCDPTHVRALPESEFDALFAAAGLRVLRRPQSSFDYDVDEWIAHGGPGPEAVREIEALLEASLETDRSGLRVRREAQKLRFSHRTVAFVLAR